MGNIIKNGEMFGTDSQTIASLETIGSAATQAYAVGNYLVGVLNGEQKVYEVTAAIAKGNTITVGTNVKATDVTTLITALNNRLDSAFKFKKKLAANLTNILKAGSHIYTSESVFNYPYIVIDGIINLSSYEKSYGRTNFFEIIPTAYLVNNYRLNITKTAGTFNTGVVQFIEMAFAVLNDNDIFFYSVGLQSLSNNGGSTWSEPSAIIIRNIIGCE